MSLAVHDYSMQAHKISDMESRNSSASFAFGAAVTRSTIYDLGDFCCGSTSIESISRTRGSSAGLGPVGLKN